MPVKQAVQSGFNASDPAAISRFALEVARFLGRPVASPVLVSAVDGVNKQTYTFEVQNPNGVKLSGVWRLGLYVSAGDNVTLPTSTHMSYSVTTGQEIGQVGEVLHVLTDADGDLVVEATDSATLAARRLYAWVESESVRMGEGVYDFSA